MEAIPHAPCEATGLNVNPPEILQDSTLDCLLWLADGHPVSFTLPCRPQTLQCPV